MISGIDVLAQEEILYTPVWASVLVIIGFLLATYSMPALTFCDDDVLVKTPTKSFIGLVVLCCVSVIIMYVGGTNSYLHTESYTYDVTISDESKMTDLLEQYEIISQKGKIYTVQEKDLDRKKSHELWAQHNADKGNDAN